MATVRELVAKFGFDIDTKPLEQFNSEFGKTKKALKTFAIGALLKGFSDIGKEFDVIRRNMGLFGNELEAMKIVDGLDRIVSSTVDASRAVRNSMEALGDLDFTKKVVQDAEDFAAITGESIDDVMAMFSAAAESQSLDPIKRLGLTGQKELEQLQRANIEMRTATVKQIILNRLAATRIDRQKKLARATGELDVQQRRFGKNMEDIGLMFSEMINPVLTELLKNLNDFIEYIKNSAFGQFLMKISLLTVVFRSLWSIGRLLWPVISMIGGSLSFLLSPITAAVAAIGFLVVWIHDLWAAFSDPTAEWFFSADSNKYFKSWVDDLTELGETFDWLSDKVGEFFNWIGKIGGSSLDWIADKLTFVDVAPANGNGQQVNKTANIIISADTIEAARAGSQEAISFLKSQGFTVNETTLNQIMARAAIQPGG